MNLITDTWIPVRRTSGRDTIRPDQIAEPDVLFPDWPRPDLNLACLELLIGLVYLACPPKDVKDWKTHQSDANALRKALKPLAPAFNLLGDGPRFLQDFDPIEGEPKSPDMLFIDSAGQSTAGKNADLMVKRDRYLALTPELAAMALYTLQTFAPSGGQGNRTSMRGGGPMVTLVRPQHPSLWPMIWANVPQGEPLKPNELEELPWMRPTATSEKGQVSAPPEGELPHPEVFFGQPRRLRLVADENGLVAGVIQKNLGTNYEGWIHPLSPYYRDKKAQLLPRHPPKEGSFGYRNWHGIVLRDEGKNRAQCLERFIRERENEDCRLVVGGWAMNNMSPICFLWSEAPVFNLNPEGEELAGRLAGAAEQAAYTLAIAVRNGKGEKDIKSAGRGTSAHEMFYMQTQAPFEAQLRKIVDGNDADISKSWLKQLHNTAFSLFNAEIMPGMADLSETRRQAAVDAHKNLSFTFSGYGKGGKKLFNALNMPLPKTRKKPNLETCNE